jgi:hypothetical protein
VKASRAYIAGLGTTGVLIASFLLLLIVVSAIVAFRGAPGEASNDGLDRLDVSQGAQGSRDARAPRSVSDDARRESARSGRERGARRSERGRDPNAGTGMARGERHVGGAAEAFAGGATGGGSTMAGDRGSESGGSGNGLPRPPVELPQPGGTPSAPSVGDVAEDLGGGVEQTTRDLGETVGNAAPPPEEPVVPTGGTMGGVAEQPAPVPDSTVSDVTGPAGGVTEGVTGATGSLPGGP